MPAVEQTKTQEQDQGQAEWKDNPSLPQVNRQSEKSRSQQDANSAEPANPKEEALEIANRCLSDLNEALSEGKSEKLQDYLAFMAKFHNYSMNNSMLISAQCPHVS